MTRSAATEDSALFLVATKPAQTQDSELSPDLLNLYGDAMDRALGIEKASLSAIVQLNSCALDLYGHLVDDLIGMAVNACAFYAEAQMSWLTLMMPAMYKSSAASLPVAASAGRTASGGDDHTHPLKGEELERSVDVAIGARSEVARSEVLPAAAPPSGRVASEASGQVRPGEAVERGMDVVIGAGEAA